MAKRTPPPEGGGSRAACPWRGSAVTVLGRRLRRCLHRGAVAAAVARDQRAAAATSGRVVPTGRSALSKHRALLSLLGRKAAGRIPAGDNARVNIGPSQTPRAPPPPQSATRSGEGRRSRVGRLLSLLKRPLLWPGGRCCARDVSAALSKERNGAPEAIRTRRGMLRASSPCLCARKHQRRLRPSCSAPGSFFFLLL